MLTNDVSCVWAFLRCYYSFNKKHVEAFNSRQFGSQNLIICK